MRAKNPVATFGETLVCIAETTPAVADRKRQQLGNPDIARQRVSVCLQHIIAIALSYLY